MRRTAALCLGFGCAALVSAGEFDVRGEIAFEPRIFVHSSRHDGQFDGVQLSGYIEPELRWRSDDRNTSARFVPFLRLDGRDDERTHADVREAYVRMNRGDWEFLLGLNRVFWGVTESRHLVNIVNQVDAVEDIDEEDFLGQPMLQIGRQTDVGRFDLFLMTGFRERTFPGSDGRLRTPLPIDGDGARYESGAERLRPDVALRYSHYIGDLDIGVHVFHGTGREPERLDLSEDGTRMIPRYSVITQAGIDLQYTREAWLWKFEGLVREGQGDTFAAAVAGVEYTLFQVGETDADLGLLAEVLHDGRDDDVFATALEEDLFVGARLALNDVQDTEMLAGVFFDVNDGPASFRVEAERRLGDQWSLELEATGFLERDAGDEASLFDRDSHLTLRLTRFF